MIEVYIVKDYKKIEGLKGQSLTEYWIRNILGINEELPIKRTDKGKPYVDGGPEFSLSHSGSILIMAVGEESVGIDLQEGRRINYEKLSARYFSMREQQAIKTPEDFFRIWTRKEAYAKYTGEGLVQVISNTDVLEDLGLTFIDFIVEDMYCSICSKETEYECFREG